MGKFGSKLLHHRFLRMLSLAFAQFAMLPGMAAFSFEKTDNILDKWLRAVTKGTARWIDKDEEHHALTNTGFTKQWMVANARRS